MDPTGDGGRELTQTGLVCASCGAQSSSTAKFCSECGTPLNQATRTAEYKQVTVLFADVVHSMDIASAVGAERLREIMADLADRCAAVVQRYGGTVDKFTGDGIMAVFGAPVALEDHAVRACLAALGIQDETTRLAAEITDRDSIELQLRVGLNSGLVIAGDIGSRGLGYTTIGEQVGMAQRMESVAPPGGVMLSASTVRLVEGAATLGDAELVQIKGADAPVPAQRLLGIGDGHRAVGRAESNLVGRRWEMSAVEGLLERAIEGHGAVVGVVGSPGIGKSRLVREVAALAGRRGVDVFTVFCESHTNQVHFHAVARLLRAATGVEGLDPHAARTRIRAQALDAEPEDLVLFDDLLGIADPEVELPKIDPDARRRRLTALVNATSLARETPAVYVVEDAHWIDEVSESMLVEFLTVIPQTPLLVLVTYRPEYRGALSRVTGAQTIALAPLTDPETAALVSELLGSDPSVGGVATMIAENSAGNPFFAEEIVRDLAERGVLRGNRSAYESIADVGEVSVPPTLQATIAARIDRLDPAAKRTLSAAAVIGSRFSRGLLDTLGIDPVLDDLVAAQFIDQVRFTGQREYVFHHPLIRTVVYESQLKSDRAELHRRVAAAIQSRDPAGAEENAALIADHLEAAGDLHAAYGWHMRAAEWLRPRDVPAARARWESARRAADRLPDDHNGVVDMRIVPRTMLISTAMYVGDDVNADERYREFRDLAMQSGDLRSLAIGTAGRIMSLTLNDNRVPEAASLAAELEAMVSGVDCDAATRSIILISVAFAWFTNCEFDAALRVIDTILALPQDEPTMELAVANSVRGYIEICCGESEQGRQRLRQGIEQARALHPVNYAIVLVYRATLVVLGMYEPDELIVELRDALRRADSFGDIYGIITAQCAYGSVLLRAQNALHDEAIDVLHRAHANIQKHKAFSLVVAITDADLALDAARRGRRDEAIDDLRTSFLLHASRGFRVFAGCTGEALVELLVERGSIDDLTEAHQIVAEGQTQRPGIPAMDLWWLKSRALLAKMEGDSKGYAEFATQYLELCEKLDARGRLDEARQMINRIV